MGSFIKIVWIYLLLTYLCLHQVIGNMKLSQEEQNKIKEALAASMKKNKDIPKMKSDNLESKEHGSSGHSFFPQPKLNDKQRFDNLLKLKKEHAKQTGKHYKEMSTKEKNIKFKKFQQQMREKMGMGAIKGAFKDKFKIKKDL